MSTLPPPHSTLPLPPHPALLSHTLSPAAVAKCHVSDLWNARFLVPAPDARPDALVAIDHYPARLLEVVGWVAGVDRKESSMTVYRESSRVLVQLTSRSSRRR